MPLLLEPFELIVCFIHNIDNNHSVLYLLNIREADIKFTEHNLCVLVYILSLENFIQTIQDN